MSDEVETFSGDGSLRWLPALLAEERIEARGVLHIGAHEAEELPIYRECGFPYIALVEPDPGAALKAQLDAPDVEVLAIAIAPGDPSLRAWQREPNTHQSHLTDGDSGAWVRTMPLGQVLPTIKPVNVLVVDTSGFELDVLTSGPLDGFDLVVVETDDLGRNAAYTALVRHYMYRQGFTPLVRWAHGQHPYGDEVYTRA